MLFHTLQFVYFFVIVFGLYLVLPHRGQNLMLLAASLIFYGAWDWRYLSLLILSAVIDYCCGIYMDRKDASESTRGRLLAVSIFANLTLLGVFKYYDFFAGSFQELMGLLGISVSPIFLNVILPVGISFYTFQTMSYTIDVYRRKLPATQSLFDFMLYVSFFPQLVAGPIERATRLMPQVLQSRKITWERLNKGIVLILFGLFLKVVIGDNLATIVDPVFNSNGPYMGIDVLLATYAFSFQIYADFAGYSTMAIGLAETMGFSLMDNFRRPYLSKNISEFWRRWHISLSSWFRDYFFSPVYISLQKHKTIARYSVTVRHGIAFFITLMFTEYLLGLWHGAGWNFGFFGIYHGLMIWLYYYTKRFWDRMPVPVQIVAMFHIACLGWLIFRAQSLGQAGDMIVALFTNFHQGLVPAAVYTGMKLIIPMAMLLIVEFVQERYGTLQEIYRWPAFALYPYLWGLIFFAVVIGSTDGMPFLYFQF